jgi:transcription-repair coupling factor (superfamily II helicase)
VNGAVQARAALDPAAVAELDDLARLDGRLKRGSRLEVGGLWGSSQALLLAALQSRRERKLLCVLSTDAEAEAFCGDLETCGLSPTLLPSREAGGPAGARTAEPAALRARLSVARALSGPPDQRPRVLVASLLALLQPLPEARVLAEASLQLARDQHLDSNHLLRRLVDAGWTRQPLVERPGEVSLRGDILDVWPWAAELPLRIELLDGSIESLRRFDPGDQRSVEKLGSIELLLASDPGGVEDGVGVAPHSVLTADTLVVEVEPLRLEDRASGLRIQSGAHQQALTVLREAMDARARLALQSLPAGDVNLDTRSVQALSGTVRQAPALLAAAAADGTRVVVLCQNATEEQRFRGVLEEAGLDLTGVETRVGSVVKGFRLPAAKLLVVNHRELAGVLGVRRATRERSAYRTRALQSFFDLKQGDYVVHAVHGLALYQGLARVLRGGAEEEHLHLVFADEVILYVPVTRIDLVQRYVGTGSGVPALDKIGGQSFRRRREKVERALFDLAADLLEVQAERELRRRAPWQAEPALMRDLKGTFPWVDTDDQSKSDAEISADLEAEQPMDRLLCGDVGFGKTELAVRAAFRVVACGGQVAVLVPTTVLAHQHLATFRERLADFPVTVEGLTRTVTGQASKLLRERVARGEVDILVGTHRILSKDVTFKRLGLAIIDEEQRFGVTHKEHFKTLRSSIDVLTLSATPIPRTLHMSLSGVRDISALATPPPGRQEIDTRLVDADDRELLREALLFEKNRGGQVFFLHNRVASIDALARDLAELVPQCSFAVAHGQMPTHQMEDIVDRFARGEVDVLVATTIVENGLDIPAAGTIFIDSAEMFGLAELHQLRGRVGRGAHKAYCYLRVDRFKPLASGSRDRLKALEELNQLGAGFAISMKDLELRGAGNILGPQQSGHIAAVGYDMYCRLLKQTIERLRAGLSREVTARAEDLAPGVELELGLDAFLPEDWIPTQGTRIEVLRALEQIESDEDARRAIEGLRDRFGRVPSQALTLIDAFRLRALALPLGITRVAWRGDRYIIEFSDRVQLESALAGARGEPIDLRLLRTGVAHLMVPESERSPARALRWLEELLAEHQQAERRLHAGAGSSRIPPTPASP